jgi:hypothetical protein
LLVKLWSCELPGSLATFRHQQMLKAEHCLVRIDLDLSHTKTGISKRLSADRDQLSISIFSNNQTPAAFKNNPKPSESQPAVQHQFSKNFNQRFPINPQPKKKPKKLRSQSRFIAIKSTYIITNICQILFGIENRTRFVAFF